MTTTVSAGPRLGTVLETTRSRPGAAPGGPPGADHAALRPWPGDGGALDGARQLLVEALQLAGNRPATPSTAEADPLGWLCTELATGHARRVRVSCTSLTEVNDRLAARPDRPGGLVAVLHADVLAAGHELQLLHHDLAALSGPDRPLLAALVADGASLRLLGGHPPEAVLIDDALALLPVGSGATLLRSPEAVRALHGCHHVLGELATDHAVVEQVAEVLVGPGPLADVLGALSCGMKDETAARQLRISVRTYRRHVAALLRVFGVASRFEAGVRISETGLADLLRRRAALQTGTAAT